MVADVDHHPIPPSFALNVSSSSQGALWQQPRCQLLQLAEETYVPPTPLKAYKLSELLSKYPDSEKVSYIIQSLNQGFTLEYAGHFKFRAPDNLPMAKLHPQLIRDRLNKEIQLDWTHPWGWYQRKTLMKCA